MPDTNDKLEQMVSSEYELASWAKHRLQGWHTNHSPTGQAHLVSGITKLLELLLITQGFAKLA